MPCFFDFPCSHVPNCMFYTQPWVTDDHDRAADNDTEGSGAINDNDAALSLDWNKLDGQPLVYMSLARNAPKWVS